MKTTKMSNFTRQSQLVSCNPSLAMIWQMTYSQTAKTVFSHLIWPITFQSQGHRPICLFLTQVDEDAPSKTLQDLYSSKTKVKFSKNVCNSLDYEYSPIFPQG